MQIIPAILENDDPLKTFIDFLSDYIVDESRQNEHQRVNFAWNLQSKRLPGYSNSMQHMQRFKQSDSPLYLASVFHELENMIMNENKKKS